MFGINKIFWLKLIQIVYLSTIKTILSKLFQKHCMLNIIYIITRSDVLGGASVHLLDLAKGMIGQGHQVHILVGGEGTFTKELKKII